MPHHERHGMGYAEVKKGAEVYGSDNKKIGEVAHVEPGYIHLTKGFLFTTDLYIPRDAIRGAEDNRVYLNVPSDRIEQMHWTERPVRGAGMGPEERLAEREGEMRIPIREEDLEVEKRMRKTGQVDIRREVTEEKKTMRVPRIHEEVTVERHKVDRPSEEPIGKGETMRVPIREERIHVEKHARVKEELVVKRHPEVEEEEITETVKRERAEVERHGMEKERHARPERYEEAPHEGREYARVPQPPGKKYVGERYIDVQEGWDVLCSDGKKIGDVTDVNPDYIHVEKGFLFTKDLYIPASAVDYGEPGKIHLNVPCDRIKQMHWDAPPKRGTTPGR